MYRAYILNLWLHSHLQAKFFMTYVFTSGWASLACELLQLYPLLCNFIRRYIFRMKDWAIDTMSFPYHTEIPRLLLFGFIGFTCSILVPLILPFLLIYFTLAYFIYRNQVRNSLMLSITFCITWLAPVSIHALPVNVA